MDIRIQQILSELRKIAGDYPKIVRDRIPEIIEQETGKCPPTSKLETGSEDAVYYSLKKILEEVVEFFEAESVDKRNEEAGDLMLSVYSAYVVKGLDIDLIMQLQEAKEKAKGGFNDRILLLEKP